MIEASSKFILKLKNFSRLYYSLEEKQAEIKDKETWNLN
jgi:hypothetical protein